MERNAMNLTSMNLQSGAAVTIRPVHVQDAELLATMYLRVSLASLCNRYLRPYTPTRAELTRICRIGADEGAVYVATIAAPRETVIGYGYYVIDKAQQPQSAEPAFLVEDRFQGQGLGRTLFQRLTQHALDRGVNTFDAYVHPANAQMMRVFHGSGLPISERLSYGTRAVRIALDTTLMHQPQRALN